MRTCRPRHISSVLELPAFCLGTLRGVHGGLSAVVVSVMASHGRRLTRQLTPLRVPLCSDPSCHTPPHIPHSHQCHPLLWSQEITLSSFGKRLLEPLFVHVFNSVFSQPPYVNGSVCVECHPRPQLHSLRNVAPSAPHHLNQLNLPTLLPVVLHLRVRLQLAQRTRSGHRGRHGAAGARTPRPPPSCPPPTSLRRRCPVGKAC